MAIQQTDVVRRGNFNQLGQLRPANTTAASLYSPKSNIVTKLSAVFITETSGTASVGAFTSVLAPEAISTFMGKYVINATTQSTTGGVNFTSGFVRCL